MSFTLYIPYRVLLCVMYFTYTYMLLDLRKPSFRTQLQIFRNTEFNYLKYYNSGREADACMKFAMIIQLFIIYLFTNYWVNS